MTLHLHSEFQPWCYRCQLSRDEAEALLAEQAACDHTNTETEDGETMCIDCGLEFGGE